MVHSAFRIGEIAETEWFAFTEDLGPGFLPFAIFGSTSSDLVVRNVYAAPTLEF